MQCRGGVSSSHTKATDTVHFKQQFHCCLDVLTSMGVWELWFALLLLPSTFFIDCEGTVLELLFIMYNLFSAYLIVFGLKRENIFFCKLLVLQ